MLANASILLALIIFSIDALPSVKVPKYLAIYYGYPSLVQNSQGNLTAATNCFKQFDLVVLGDGIWKTAHDDHANTEMIIRNLITAGKKVFGYVDLGVKTQNLTEAQMREAVDGWSAMGANGIFWDDAGFDYNVTRDRQSVMIQYCHSKTMNVIMNAWKPDDVFAGDNVQMNANDIYLLESYLVSNGGYLSLVDWEIKANKCANYQSAFGSQMACLSTPKNNDQFTQAWFGTAIYNFDYFQSTENSYGSNNNSLAFTPNPSSSYGTIWLNNTVTSNTAKTLFTRSTDSWTLKVAGDGSSWGYGTFVASG